MGAHAWIDSTRGRIHILTIPGDAAVMAAEGPSFVTSFRKLWQDIDQQVGVVTDFSSMVDIPPSFRKAAAEVDREMHEKQRRLCVAWGVVIKSNVQRLLFQGYLWIAPPAGPYQIFSTRSAALTWVRAELERAGVPLAADQADIGQVLASARSLAESVQGRKPK